MLKFKLFLLILLLIGRPIQGANPPEISTLMVDAGKFDRRDVPLQIDLDPALVKIRLALDLPKRVRLQEICEDGEAIGNPVDAQLDLREDRPHLTFVLPGLTPAGMIRTFQFDPSALTDDRGPWILEGPFEGFLDLKRGDSPVFRYVVSPVSNPAHPTIPARDAYLHPAYTPSGAVVTGDFSTSHPHHRGFFLAYTKTKVGDLHPDFWNYQNGTGKIEFDRLELAVAGPSTARIKAGHRWEAKGAGTVLKESWEIEAFDIPGSPYWMFDLTSTQQAIGKPLELVPYRYGGMAYRGPEPFYHGKIDVLTSSGFGRVEGDQKPARWVDLTGPTAEGSTEYGGAMILDHPSNPNHPTVARIHPTTIPFFTYTPAHDVALVIETETPKVFRYRIVIHDGRPDGTLDDRLWNDFAEPPVVTIVTKVP